MSAVVEDVLNFPTEIKMQIQEQKLYRNKNKNDKFTILLK